MQHQLLRVSGAMIMVDRYHAERWHDICHHGSERRAAQGCALARQPHASLAALIVVIVATGEGGMRGM